MTKVREKWHRGSSTTDMLERIQKIGSKWLEKSLPPADIEEFTYD